MERYGRDAGYYMGVKYSIVWDVIKNKIPELFEQIAFVIENE
jgi:uncharacterized protein with HEPN domain